MFIVLFTSEDQTMKTIKYIVTLATSLTISLSSYATTIVNTIPWGTTSGGFGTAVSYSSDYDSDLKYFEALISHSQGGKQRLYFANAYLDDDSMCSYETGYPTSTTVVFNGQAVKMSRWCLKFNGTNKYYYSYTPETERGHSYVVNLFKTSVSPVRIKLDTESLYLPAIGFSKIWNNAGGNAI